ncbi:ABC transporter permease [Olivibacter sp. 47]|uniref:ABC transporter permease n=1 Tax=Olivibacter sp. 47 TaxID=3056486 RepID=UPI0025A39136|nr:ABC transporter permease [Olivibacter sp. 47]MDM8173671.1 ABC transporter permease [Olivibacter sp. 47]
MIRNYCKTALRSLNRNRGYTLTNVLGLTLGIACKVFIFSLVKYHLSVDAFHAKKNRIYRIVTENRLEQTVYSPGGPPPLGRAFREDYTFGEKVARIYVKRERLISLPHSSDNQKFLEEDGVAFAEPDFFHILDFPLVKGDKNTVLTNPNTALITERVAKKYFGDTDPMGKIIRLDNKLNFRIDGILRDLPENTDRRQEIYLSYGNLKDYNPWAGNDNNWLSYADELQSFVLLKPGVLPATVNQAFHDFSSKYYDGNYVKEWRFRLQPLSDIHFNPDFDGKITKQSLWALSLIAVFLIITASVNFVNLATAQALNRAKEIGIRKTLGSFRKQLFWQFMVETALIVFIAIVLAFMVLYWALPLLRSVFEVPVMSIFFYDYYLLIFLPLLFLLITFLSGAYPGLVLAGFQPVLALKGKISERHTGGFSLRRGLVVTQFTISQLLIIGTLVIAHQINFTRQTDMGFTKDAIVTLPLPTSDKSTVSTLRSEFSRLAGVERVSFCTQAPASESGNSFEIVYDTRTEKENYDVVFKGGDEQYLSTFGLELLAGRNLHSSDTVREYLINETLAKKLGVSNDGVIGKNAIINDTKGTIVGVVKDFHNQSFHTGIDPLCITTQGDWYNRIAVKINPSNLRRTLEAIAPVWKVTFPNHVYEYDFLDDQIARFYEQDYRILRLVQTFAGIAIIIGCLGLYGLVSFMITQKTKEVGVRKVLGASIRNILWLYGREFVRLLLIAFLIATPVAWWIMNSWLENFVYRINIGAGIFIMAIAITLVIAMLTVGYRSLKAALMNPVKSLKTE